jgi:hypothetical protein
MEQIINIVIDLAVTWWQFTVVGILIAVGFIINMCGVDNKKKRVGFEYNVMPQLRPIAIPTAGKGFWGAIWMWLTGTRHWEVADDWSFGNYLCARLKRLSPQLLYTFGSPELVIKWVDLQSTIVRTTMIVCKVFFLWVGLYMIMHTNMQLYSSLVRKKQWVRLLKNKQTKFSEILILNKMVFTSLTT